MAEQQWKSVEELLRAMTGVVEFDTEEPPSVNSKGIFGNSPLKVASVWGDEEAVRLLVSSGARIDEKNENGY
ncbi:MAG: ankyrin repeat domain-containing protein, partial [Gammaproteobacteria bacterium]|nr:ankyrin repeat domain-containing protein [Gammaproteobacteria bacterium]